MASISLKLSIWSVILCIFIFVMYASSIVDGVSAGRDKMTLTLQEPNVCIFAYNLSKDKFNKYRKIYL